LLYEGSADQPRGAPFSFSYKKEQEKNESFDRNDQVWSPNGVIRGNEDHQFAVLERNDTAIPVAQDYENRMDIE